MDPFRSVRPLYPHPLLFGLVDDVGSMILREHLGLEDGAVAHLPDKAWLCLTLRLVNRETYLLCERHCFPSMMNIFMNEGQGGRLDIAPWYYRSSLVLSAIRTRGLRIIFREPTFWRSWGWNIKTSFLEAAVQVQNMVVIHGLVRSNTHTFATDRIKVEGWISLLIAGDAGDAYIQLLRMASESGNNPVPIVDADLAMMVKFDAICCFKQLLLEYANAPPQRLQFLTTIGAQCFLGTSDAVCIREALADELCPRRSVKRATDKDDDVDESPAKRQRIE